MTQQAKIREVRKELKNKKLWKRKKKQSIMRNQKREKKKL